ncbi:ATP-binding protein [Rubrivirga marina]|uniref:Orc1-like AAA ATPase domain-containing protein n=1 Tax=Rubrivirga marina TaxID=1196024 RepID=A0A271IXY9_9BACT|nr:ATP-binding protein [Rubrivirga marina]PAP76062.1 hypothetical protein BSZ37_06200 [Rubrivirga marina]
MIRGEAGIGKTALLQLARRHAEAKGALVLSTTGIQAEASLPFAGLHHLLPEIDNLPAPQRDAMCVAFGMSAGSAPNRFLLGLATLTLLSEAAGHRSCSSSSTTRSGSTGRRATCSPSWSAGSRPTPSCSCSPYATGTGARS